jgi:hypothetical protein
LIINHESCIHLLIIHLPRIYGGLTSARCGAKCSKGRSHMIQLHLCGWWRDCGQPRNTVLEKSLSYAGAKCPLYLEYSKETGSPAPGPTETESLQEGQKSVFQLAPLLKKFQWRERKFDASQLLRKEAVYLGGWCSFHWFAMTPTWKVNMPHRWGQAVLWLQEEKHSGLWEYGNFQICSQLLCDTSCQKMQASSFPLLCEPTCF